jgi:hypothetical protein
MIVLTNTFRTRLSSLWNTCSISPKGQMFLCWSPSLRITRSPSWMFSSVCCHFRRDCKVCKYSRRQRDQNCSARTSVLAGFQCKLILLLLLQGSGWQPIHLWLWYGAAANLPIWYDTTWHWSYLPQQKWPIAEFIIWI